MIVKVENVEIRGVEVKQSRTNGADYMIVRFEDVTGRNHEIIDRDMERKPFYSRGVQGDLYADLDIGKTFTRFTVTDFKAANKDG